MQTECQCLSRHVSCNINSTNFNNSTLRRNFKNVAHFSCCHIIFVFRSEAVYLCKITPSLLLK